MRPGTPSRAAALVARWATRYTRDLDPQRALDRREELASDVWEQTEAGRTSGRARRTELAIVGRMVRGIPADLAWRRRQLGDDGASVWMRVATTSTSLLPRVIAAGTLAVGAVALARIVATVSDGAFPPSAVTVTSLVIGMVAVICGLRLLRRPRTRRLGAAWSAAGTLAVLHFSGVALLTVSATAQAFADPLDPSRFAGDPALSIIAGTGIVVVYALLALASSPASTTGRAAS